jgi:2Fe-2S ferredoxin
VTDGSAIIEWVGEDRRIEVPLGTDLREAAKRAGAQQGDSCGGKCACSTCHVYVVEGAKLLSEKEEEEEDTLDKGFDVRATSRLGCQSKVVHAGVVRLVISDESRMSFFDEHPDLAPAGWRVAR